MTRNQQDAQIREANHSPPGLGQSPCVLHIVPYPYMVESSCLWCFPADLLIWWFRIMTSLWANSSGLSFLPYVASLAGRIVERYKRSVAKGPKQFLVKILIMNHIVNDKLNSLVDWCINNRIYLINPLVNQSINQLVKMVDSWLLTGWQLAVEQEVHRSSYQYRTACL